MSLHIAGMGWITPLGSGVQEVWERLLRGDEPSAEALVDTVGGKSHDAFRVPPAALTQLPLHPRLRRASAISRFAAAAGTAALREAEVHLGTTIDPASIALIFAISNGGVIYTKRFYRDVVASGAETASPLLFPETVFNAPASHLAALLGVTGPTYTIVGDGSVGLSAVNMAEDLMRNSGLDFCLVVGAEETDWLLCDAYARWRLLRSHPPIEPFAQPPRGMIPSEGAGAILVGRSGPVRIKNTHPANYYRNRKELSQKAEALLREMDASSAGGIVSSANGTFIDAAEAAALSRVTRTAPSYVATPSLGEGIGASGLWQVIIASQAACQRRLPRTRHIPMENSFHGEGSPSEPLENGEIVVLTCGLNQQLSALRLCAE
jgi:3-oxoacyl-[acyl-carrier-protein] synthase II